MANLALYFPAPGVASRFAAYPAPLRQDNATRTSLAAPSTVALAARLSLSVTKGKPDGLKKPVDIFPALQPFRADNMKLIWDDIGHGLQHAPTMIRAAWTRRSSGQPPARKNKKSWGQRTDKYMKPFMLDINISRRYLSAKVMHRVTSKVVSVVSTNSQDLRNSLPSLIDANACKAVGRILAERAKEADVFAVTYEPRKGEKLEGRLALILDTILANEIVLV